MIQHISKILNAVNIHIIYIVIRRFFPLQYTSECIYLFIYLFTFPLVTNFAEEVPQ